MAITGMAEVWATVGSTIASVMFVSAMIRQYCPFELRRFLGTYGQRLMVYFYPYIRISIHEHSRSRFKHSEAYASVEAYLSVNSNDKANRLRAEQEKDSNKLVLSMDEHERTTDEFRGVRVWWLLGKIKSPTQSMSYFPEPEKRYYRLTVHKRYRELITDHYLEHVIKEGKEIRLSNRQRKLYTNSSNERWARSNPTMWSHVPFEHPATFKNIAMEPEKKNEIMEDLLNFSKSKDFYADIGKAWKRGYLLHGPPGTGKSTMIAAMANLLSYDVYDLELTSVKDNTELRKLLIETTGKSIIVIEDIDCSLNLTGQRKGEEKNTVEGEDEKMMTKPPKMPRDDNTSKVTLSGLLNFIDGLWSACGGERLIVFTTNYIEKLDPALIRRGRMDKHIELSYCSFEGFKVLARNYLKLEAHPAFEPIERLMEETKITPADVAENLMPKSRGGDAAEKCLSNLIQALEKEKEKAAAMKKAEMLEDKEPNNKEEDANKSLTKQEIDEPQ